MTRIASRVDAIEVLLDRVQERVAVSHGLVARVVHEPREAVHRPKVPPGSPREHEERDREVLAARLREHVVDGRRADVRPHADAHGLSPRGPG